MKRAATQETDLKPTSQPQPQPSYLREAAPLGSILAAHRGGERYAPETLARRVGQAAPSRRSSRFPAAPAACEEAETEGKTEAPGATYIPAPPGRPAAAHSPIEAAGNGAEAPDDGAAAIDDDAAALAVNGPGRDQRRAKARGGTSRCRVSRYLRFKAVRSRPLGEDSRTDRLLRSVMVEEAVSNNEGAGRL